MAGINPLQLLQQIKNGNPRAVAEQIIQTNYSNNPMMMNLLRMGQNGDVRGLEQFAKQYFEQQGRDFNTEMNNLFSTIQNM